MSSQKLLTTTRRGGVWWPETDDEPPEDATIDVVIPALDEEKSLPMVLANIPWAWVRRVVVADNGSSDDTARVAEAGGAEVVRESQRGYGAACLAALEHLRGDPPDIVVFMDADFSDYPQELPRVVGPILADDAELVIGSRTIGQREQGALLPQAVFGNELACTLIKGLYGYRFTDLGPFRAVTWRSLQRIDMQDEDFGWTVEMQVKAAKLGLPTVEVPVSYRKRVGVSKVTGTLEGTVKAGQKILYTIFRQYVSD